MTASSNSDADRADPVAKAERLGGGASASPPSSDGNRWSPERKAAASERMKAAHAAGIAPKGRKPGASSSKAVPEPITPEEEKMVGVMIGALWNVAGPMVKLSKLDEEEQFTIGRAAVPVMRKYLPMLGDWQAEITLLVVTATLVTAKRAQWKSEHPEDTTIPDIPRLFPAEEVPS